MCTFFSELSCRKTRCKSFNGEVLGLAAHTAPAGGSVCKGDTDYDREDPSDGVLNFECLCLPPRGGLCCQFGRSKKTKVHQ